MTGEKVAIIGAGISGLCSALVLQQNGIQVEVYDQDSSGSKANAGMILGGNALKALESFGLGEKVKKIGLSSDRCLIYSELGRSITNLTYPSSETHFLALHAADFSHILLESLKAGTVHYEKTLVNFKQTETNIELCFNDGTMTTCDYIIACDGGQSFIRSQLLPEVTPQDVGITCWQAIVDWEDEKDVQQYSETWGPRGIFGISPLPNQKLCWYALKKCSPNLSCDEWDSFDLLFNFFSYHEPIHTILEKTENTSIIQKRLFKLPPLPQYLYGRILLLGESAHMVPPSLGQASSQAIEDALYLAKWITSEHQLIDAFKKYEKYRLIRSKKVFIDMDRLQKLAQLDKPALCTIRNKFLRLIPPSFHQNKLKNILEIESIH